MLKENNLESNLPAKESKLETRDYYSPKIRVVEKFMTPLVNDLKESIENGQYDALLSDDSGGRIPTLLLWEIIKRKGPANKKIGCTFLAAGRKMPSPPPFLFQKSKEYDPIDEYIKKARLKGKRLLVVTQFVGTGRSLIKISQALKRHKIENFDFLTMMDSGFLPIEDIALELGRRFNSKLFSGDKITDFDYSNAIMLDNHSELSGIKSSVPYSPYPTKSMPSEYDNVIFRENPELCTQYYSTTDAREREYLHSKIYHMAIIKRTEDIRLMADRIIAQVWGDNKQMNHE